MAVGTLLNLILGNIILYQHEQIWLHLCPSYQLLSNRIIADTRKTLSPVLHKCWQTPKIIVIWKADTSI